MYVAGWDDANDQGGRVVVRWDKSTNDPFAGIGRAIPGDIPVTGQPGRPDGYDVEVYTTGEYTGDSIVTYTITAIGSTTYEWTSGGADGSGGGTVSTNFVSIGTLGVEIAFSDSTLGGNEMWTIRCTPPYSSGDNVVTEYRVLRHDSSEGSYHFVASQAPDAYAVPSTDVDTYAQDGPGDGVLGVYHVVAYTGTNVSPMGTNTEGPQTWHTLNASNAKVGDIFILGGEGAVSADQTPSASLLSNPAEAMSLDNIAPDAVTDASVEIVGDDLMFTWTAITEGQGQVEIQSVRYNIYRAANEPYFEPGPDNLHDTVSTATFTDFDAVGDLDNNYFYVVRAFDGTHVSSFTDEYRVGEYDNQLVTTAATNWTFIAAPVDAEGITDASELLAAIPNADAVAEWDAINQEWLTYFGVPTINNFSVTPGHPYLVSVTADTVWSVAGSLTEPSFDLVVSPTTDWNGVSVPLTRTDIENAEQLLAAIPNAVSVSKWDAPNQEWLTYFGVPTINNFSVTAGGAYLVSVTEEGVWDGSGVPPAPAKAAKVNPRLILKPVILK
jgi:hypothetical protein